MAIALVKAGAVATSSSVATITPAFGQTTGAGNLLIACVAANNGTTITTSSTGWNAVTATQSEIAIFYKQNSSAAEAAPTFNFTSTPSTGYALLAEFSGAATASPLDEIGVTAIQANPRSTSCAAADSTNSDVAISNNIWFNSKSATYTFSDSWTPAAGTAGVLGDTSATKNTQAVRFSYYLLNGHGGSAADSLSETCTPSTGTITSPSIGGRIASFTPPVVAHSLVSGTPQRALAHRHNTMDRW